MTTAKNKVLLGYTRKLLFSGGINFSWGDKNLLGGSIWGE